jgi:hypothetical protein
MAYNPAYRAAHSGGTLLGALGSLWGPFWLSAFVSVGAVTIVFAGLERVQGGARFLEDWDPRKLPPVRDPKQIPWSASIAELLISVAFIVWCVSTLGFRTVFDFAGARITLAPQWRYFLCGFLLVSLTTVAVSFVNLFHPCWTRLRASIRLAYNCVGSALICWLLKAAILMEITAPNVPPEKTLALTNAINLWASRSFPIAVLACALIALVDIRRIFRVKTTVTRLAQCAAAAILLTLMATEVSAQTPTYESPARRQAHRPLLTHRSLNVTLLSDIGWEYLPTKWQPIKQAD